MNQWEKFQVFGVIWLYKELSDKKGSKSNGPYKEIVGEIRDKELFDKNRNKLDGNYRKLISDIPDEELFFDKEDTY